MVPEVMAVNPATALSSVLLPQPDGPRSTWSSPGLTSREQSSTATTWPAPVVHLADVVEDEVTAGHDALLARPSAR